MLKKILFITLITITSTMAQGDHFNLRFWDGTFAYNQLIVKSNPQQQNIITLELSGSQIHLGQQIEGHPQMWSHRDLMAFSLRKSDCETLDIKNEVVECTVDKVMVHNLTWQINPKITKTYSGLVQNLKIFASKKIVSVAFTLPSDEDFTPHQDTINVSFFSTFF